MKRLAARIAAMLFAATMSAPASAGTASFSGEIIIGSPTFPVVFISTPNCTGQGVTPVMYRAFPFTVDVAGSYVFTSPHSATAVYLHAGSFNPASPLATCFAADNGTINFTVALATGTQYVMVITDDTFAQDGVNFAITMTGPGNIHGQCAEFTDVDHASSFCGNVQWLKNRGVTLGCTATQYCPNDPVSRLQMAAFINRLGTAVQRVVLHAAQSAASATINAGGVVCQTSTYNVDAYRRTATPASVAFYHRAPTAVRVTAQLVHSLDAGANWIPIGQTLRATNVANEYAAQSPAAGPFALVRGQNVMFGILAAPSVATVNDAGCELLMKIDGVTDAIAPFDPRPDAPEAPSFGGR